MSSRPNRSQAVRRRKLGGFTLIEIMLVVVIIGILSTFAIPYFLRVTARSRRAEAMIVLDKVHVYFVNQYENYGTFNTPEVLGMFGGAANGISQWNPDPGTTTGQPAKWVSTRLGWKQIPFAFDGGLKLRFSYQITANDSLTIAVAGEMPGLGPDIIIPPSFGPTPTGNYLYTEVLQGSGGSVFITPPIEIPAM